MKMMKRYIEYLLLAALLLPLSCRVKEEPMESEEQLVQETSVIPYTITVSKEPVSKASLSAGAYRFSAGDRLFITGTGGAAGKIYGTLDMVSGAGSASAVFRGELTCVGTFRPDPSTPLSVTLVGSADTDRIHSISGSTINTVYPTDEYTTSLEDAVVSYSHFTASGTYEQTAFTLEQQSSFLTFDLKFDGSSVPDDTPVTVTVGDRLLTISVVPTSYYGASEVTFMAPLRGGTDLSGAAISVDYEDDNLLSASFGPSVTAAANHYYNVPRSNVTIGWPSLELPPTSDFTTSQAFPVSVSLNPNPAEEDKRILKTLSLDIVTPGGHTISKSIGVSALQLAAFEPAPATLLTEILTADSAPKLPEGTYTFTLHVNAGHPTLARNISTTMMVLKSNYSPNGTKWQDLVSGGLGANDYVEVKMTTTHPSDKAKQNVIGIGQDIGSWSGAHAILFYYPCDNTTTRTMRLHFRWDGGDTFSAVNRNMPGANLNDDALMMVRFGRDGVFTNYFWNDDPDGRDAWHEYSGNTSDSYRNRRNTVCDNDMYVGSEEGSMPSYATYHYIRVVKYN